MVNVGDEVLIFYNDKASRAELLGLMRSERERMDEASKLRYHMELVNLLSNCTEGKNASTEIQCHSLLPLDDIVAIVQDRDCIPEVSCSCRYIGSYSRFIGSLVLV